MMIELRYLRCFVAVAEELNFRRAAERIHIDQTPLSRTIRDLEDRLNVRLFVRAPRNLQLTPAGHKLLDEARKLFIRCERIKRVVRQTHGLYQAPLRIGVADGIAQPKLAECINLWRTVSPQVPLELVEMRARELVAALKNEEVDVGFSFGVPEDKSIAQMPAWRYRLMAVLPHGHELTNQHTVALPDLLAFPLQSWNEDRFPGLVAQMRRIVGKYTKHTITAEEAFTLSGCVTRIASGAGVGIGDAGHTEAINRGDVLTLPLDEEEYIDTFVLHKNQRFAHADRADNFLTHVKSLY